MRQPKACQVRSNFVLVQSWDYFLFGLTFNADNGGRNRAAAKTHDSKICVIGGSLFIALLAFLNRSSILRMGQTGLPKIEVLYHRKCC
jgi:hypothetical protein